MNTKKIYNFKILNPNDKIKNVIKELGKSEHKIIFFEDNDSHLIGSITDGDLRRFMEKNEFDLNKKASDVMNKNPKHITIEDFKKNENNIEKYLNYNVNYLPVLDSDKIIFILYFSINLQTKYNQNNKVVVMAGGKGIRMLPLTRVIPKPLVPFHDKTIIEKIMEQFINCGFENFILTLNYKKDMIKDYLSVLDYNVEYVEEKEFLGTAGSIKLADKKINSTFFVTNCDILLNIDYNEVLKTHEKNNSDITIVASLEESDIPYGVIDFDNNNNYIGMREKPNMNYLANTGIYVLNQNIIELINKDEVLDMPKLISRAKNKNMNIRVFTVPHKMTDIGQWEYYKKFINQ